MNVKLKWHGPVPPEQVINKTMRELGELLEDGLDCPSDLFMHNVFFGKTMDGPSVFVWGDTAHPDEFQCEYREATVWESIDVLDKGPLTGKTVRMPK